MFNKAKRMSLADKLTGTQCRHQIHKLNEFLDKTNTLLCSVDNDSIQGPMQKSMPHVTGVQQTITF